ncbi:hypothetical protein [Undibacterium flavidum]|uniref:Uncharacterized protein n=1 Tax=Undibacterium flavidum TaxID=2762297 RepID=A0ABR6Y9S8_9BURK|nr:hypothetical protein [Undibacterium flavidum]MBC3873365.1 hypothetical protein [Undibacterium flavidum]
MKYSEIHWKSFNFLTRRVMALSFIVGGAISTMYGIPSILPGGTILVEGVPSDDLVLRWTVVLLPSLVVVLGIALYRVAPSEPKKK